MKRAFLFVTALVLFVSFFGGKAHRPKYVPKIYDCFMFFNEFETLELRLQELYPYVDKFVIVESCETHRTAKPKPFYFELNQERFAPFLDKIIYIKLTEHIEGDDGWARENWQRNQIKRGLVNCHPSDLILISDCDEFIPGAILSQVHEHVNQYGYLGFWQKMYRWYLNRDAESLWSGTIAVEYKHLANSTPQKARDKARSDPSLLRWHMGWHFTSLGGYETVKEKYYSIVEGYETFPSYEEWRRSVVAHKSLPIDTSYPIYIQDHIKELTQKDLIDSDPIYIPWQ